MHSPGRMHAVTGRARLLPQGPAPAHHVLRLHGGWGGVVLRRAGRCARACCALTRATLTLLRLASGGGGTAGRGGQPDALHPGGPREGGVRGAAQPGGAGAARHGLGGQARQALERPGWWRPRPLPTLPAQSAAGACRAVRTAPDPELRGAGPAAVAAGEQEPEAGGAVLRRLLRGDAQPLRGGRLQGRDARLGPALRGGARAHLRRRPPRPARAIARAGAARLRS
eukprot:scaffold685_cov324-Prasinococcus_capsulatus_cf.AAC.14